MDRERRQAHLELHAARRAGMARRSARDVGRLHRLAEALERPRRHGPEAHELRRRSEGGECEDLHDEAEGTLRPRARHARQVDRVEWVWIADPQTQVNALLNGEIDFIEAPPHDLIPLLVKDANIKTLVVAPMGRQYAFRFNVLHKPFDNAKARQAVAYALNQKDFLNSTIGDAEFYVTCKSLYPCGSPLETTRGWEDKIESNFAKAKALLAEAGYDGTPVVLMQSTDIASLANLAPVAKSLLEKAGFKVDLHAMDWQTLVSRRAKREPLASGGWSGYLTSWGSVDVLDPVSTNFLNASCEKATFGWPCDAELERLRDAFAKETDPAKQKAIAEAVSVRATEYPTHVHLGQYVQPVAFRKGVTGILASPSIAFWNVEVK